MVEFALGWLGWSEEQTLHSDINALWIAQQGHLRKLEAIHGDPEASKQRELERARQRQIKEGQGPKGDNPVVDVTGKARMLTPDSFDRLFGGRPTNKSVVVGSRVK